MLQVLGEVLPLAVTVALSPLPIIAVLIILMAPVGARGGVSFLLGRVATLAAAAFVVALLARGLASEDRGADRSGWIGIGLGILLVILAVVVWMRRSRDAEPAVPGWMRSLEQ